MLASGVKRLFEAHKHRAMATIRRDGAPRISGTEVQFEDGQMLLGMMRGTRRAIDLRRDPRLAIHSQGVDPPPDRPAEWPGEAKVSGRAVELGVAEDGSQRFRVDVEEVVLTKLGDPADHLLIESWRPGGDVKTQRR